MLKYILFFFDTLIKFSKKIFYYITLYFLKLNKFFQYLLSHYFYITIIVYLMTFLLFQFGVQMIVNKKKHYEYLKNQQTQILYRKNEKMSQYLINLLQKNEGTAIQKNDDTNF